MPCLVTDGMQNHRMLWKGALRSSNSNPFVMGGTPSNRIAYIKLK